MEKDRKICWSPRTNVKLRRLKGQKNIITDTLYLGLSTKNIKKLFDRAL